MLLTCQKSGTHQHIALAMDRGGCGSSLEPRLRGTSSLRTRHITATAYLRLRSEPRSLAMQLAMQTVRDVSLLLFALGAAALVAPILLFLAYAASVVTSALVFP